MKNIILCLVIWMGCRGVSNAETAHLGVPISKPSVFTFEEEISDVEIGNQDYHIKIRENSLLISAKHKKAQPTTLFVLYGEKKSTYVAEVHPDEEAPLLQVIKQNFNSNDNSLTARQQTTFQDIMASNLFSNKEKQEYFSYGVRSGGIQIILTNILHQGDVTYLRFFLDNQTNIQLKFPQVKFDYLSFERKLLFFKTKKSKVVQPINHLSTIEVASNSMQYFVVAIPSHVCDRLDVNFEEGEQTQGERSFTISIPSKVLVKARRK